MFEEPSQIEPMHIQQPLRPKKPSRPSLPKLDLFASTRSPVHHGELTPASSGPGSAAASPLSSGYRSPFLHPSRKASMPIRRPPSPELLSQDCAFPPFPTSKSKKKDSTKNAKDRTRPGESNSSRTFEQQRSRSASLGAHRSRSRHGTADSSRPSTASSSRQPSLSSRAGSRQGSRQGSIDVPPIPVLQSMPSHTASDPGVGIANARVSTTSGHTEYTTASFPSTVEAQFSETSTYHLPPPAPPAISEPFSQTSDEIAQQREPLYRSKRPPPITDMPSSFLEQSQIPKSEHSPSAASFSQAPSSNTITRTLTSLFGRKRNLSTSSKKSSSKAPATDGPRFMALSPDPDPQETPTLDPSPQSSLIADMSITPAINGVQEGSCSPVDIHAAHHIPEPHKAEFLQSDDASDYGDSDDAEQQLQNIIAHDEQRDTLQLEQDLEKRLAAMGAVPRLSVVDESNEDVKRASIDSASSYGSIGFSHSSVSSRSFQGFEGHSQGSSISTARTTSTTDELLLFPKPRSVDLIPDSPTDPYMQHVRLDPVPEIVKTEESTAPELDSYLQTTRLSTVHEVQSPEEEKSEHSAFHRNAVISSDSEPDSYGFPMPPKNRISVPNTPLSPGDATLSPMSELRQRRPSTPGAFRGMCRGCSKVIVGGQKSVSSKDGQLTGRYHKECFTCMTCNEPFATADFYVYDDQPYCAYHYHEKNNTLCEGCGKGIEGQYLETSNVAKTGAKKYHPSCLQCATCKIQLDEDYFELGGRVYCERDAFRVASGPRSPYGTMPSRPSPLNREYINSNEPGHTISAGRFPERRLTRLMTTN